MKLLPDTDPLLHEIMPRYEDWDNAEQFGQNLIDEMNDFGAVGLAANQVGIRTSACAVKLSTGDLMMFNPTILFLGTDVEAGDEGCLSYPDLYLKVKRPTYCIVRYQDAEQIPQSLTLKDMDARIAMHEIDHLNGTTFVTKVSKLQLSRAKKKAKKLRK